MFFSLAESTSLSGLAGGPPTDQELSERGLGFPVHRPPSIPAEMSSEPSSPPRSHNNHHSPAVTAIKTMSPPALVAREIDEHIRSTASTPQRREGYVPPSPPNEVIIAVAISKAEQQRQHVKQAAHQQQQGPPTAGISMMDERLPPSRPSSQPPLPPVLPAGVKGALTFVNPSESLLHPADGQDATVMSDTSPATSIKGRKGLHAPSGGGILKNSHTAVGAGTVSGSGAGNPSVTAGTTGAGAGSSSICSPPTSGNGYSLGASLPRGVTWRYVDVLSNQQT